MTSEEVLRLIENEIAGNWTRSNAHGVDLRRCLLRPPRKQVFEDLGGTKIELWRVLDENPGGGYSIVFDEEEGSYGLATEDIRRGWVFIGYYGTFLETLENM